MDNLSSHKTSDIVRIVEANDFLEILFLSSYSPEFSAIETLFAHIKK